MAEILAYSAKSASNSENFRAPPVDTFGTPTWPGVGSTTTQQNRACSAQGEDGLLRTVTQTTSSSDNANYVQHFFVGPTCKKVVGTVVNGDDHVSTAKCEGDTYAVGCKCIMSSHNGYCDGVTVSDDGKECRAHGAHGGGAVKAEACCAAVKGKVSVASNLSYKQASSVSCSCPGSKLIACYLHSYWGPNYKNVMTAKRDGNRCYADAACNRCGVQAICSK